jgi:sugar lactone lactonase YvrE
MTGCNDTIVSPENDGITTEIFNKANPADNHVLAGVRLAEGEAEVIYTFSDQPTSLSREPEGIAIDPRGNIYVSDRKSDGVQRVVNEIIKITPAGQSTIIADLGPAAPGCNGILGLTTDPEGNVYAAFTSCNENHGVWKISRNGEKMRLAGSQEINVPNALTFDKRGNLYVTDSYPVDPEGPGLIWRYGKENMFEIWASSFDLAPDPVINPFPFDAPGVNGIAFSPPNLIYVANTEKSTILEIGILPNGDSMTPVIVAGAWPPIGPPGLLTAPDGLTVDVNGVLYAVVPPAGLTPFPLSPLIRIDPATGVVSSIIEPYVGPSPLFDFPTSLAFGSGRLDRKSVFVVNPTDSGTPLGAGQAITQVGVGVPGRMGQ